MSARFVMSSPNWEGLTDLGLPEVAFAGRSNVGKSSLVGALIGKPRLVRASRTPGRTQLLNLFVWDEKIAIVDLPGYGYAKLSHVQRAQLSTMMQNYLAYRPGLSGVVMVLDARRENATPLDKELAAWLLQHNRAVFLAITKADLLPKTRQLQQLRVIEKAMGVPAGCALLCSSKQAQGQVELRRRLLELRAAC